jgi:SAM-dependent methyltransferase
LSHHQQQAFVGALKAAFPQFFSGGRVLEVGSLDINGSIRAHFKGANYTGLDVGEGPGVDVVCEGQKYDAPDNSFDVVVSAECMEHNPYWRETFSNMLRLCRPGGLVLMTCATTGRPEHGTRRTTPHDAPLIEWDYYRNLKAEDFRNSIPLGRHLIAWMFCTDLSSRDLYFAGFKKGAAPPHGARRALTAIWLHYVRKNFRIRLAAAKRFSLIFLVGERRYMRGSLLPWKR